MPAPEYLSNSYDLADDNVINVIDDLPLWSAPFGLKLLDVVRIESNIRILDVGSGFGFPIIELSQRLGQTCCCVGIDSWREATKRISKKLKVWNIKNLTIIQGNAENLPFENQSFDVIVSNNGTNNVQDDKNSFSEISRVCKIGAQLVITVNLEETFAEFYEIFKKVVRQFSLNSYVDKIDEHIYEKRKPLSYTKDILKRNGFKIVNIYNDNFCYRFTDGSSLLNHFLIKLAFFPSWKSILENKEENIIFTAIEKEFNKIALTKKSLQLSVPWVCIEAEKIT